MDFKSKSSLIAAFAVVIVVGLSIFFSLDGDMIPGDNGNRSETWNSVPNFTKVPEIGESEVGKNIATPVSLVPEVKTLEGYRTDPMTRTFTISAFEDKFSPDTIIVYEGDRPRVKISAIDKDYTVIQPDYGIAQTIPKGETKLITFRASAVGKFTLLCESCGDPQNSPLGYIIVKNND